MLDKQLAKEKLYDELTKYYDSDKIIIFYDRGILDGCAYVDKNTFEKWNEFEFKYKQYNNVYYVPIQHHSYMYVYKRNKIDEYINGIKNTINKLMKNTLLSL